MSQSTLTQSISKFYTSVSNMNIVCQVQGFQIELRQVILIYYKTRHQYFPFSFHSHSVRGKNEKSDMKKKIVFFQLFYQFYKQFFLIGYKMQSEHSSFQLDKWAVLCKSNIFFVVLFVVWRVLQKIGYNRLLNFTKILLKFR